MSYSRQETIICDICGDPMFITKMFVFEDPALARGTRHMCEDCVADILFLKIRDRLDAREVFEQGRDKL